MNKSKRVALQKHRVKSKKAHEKAQALRPNPTKK